MLHQTACEAISDGMRLEIQYDGYTRVVEVHACGDTKDGNAIMRVWQVRGGSVENQPVGWKLLRLDKTIGHGLINEASEAPRQGYRRGDKAMRTIFCQV